jgi:hypothetical protein
MEWRRPYDTEGKDWWTDYGTELERRFLEEVAPKLRLPFRRNPDKEHDPTLPDFLVGEELADLKCQNTPFFKARQLYGLEPATTVTFNVKDYDRYLRRWPEIWVYFYVRWETLCYRDGPQTITVPFVHGVWRARIGCIRELVESGRAPRHPYRRRRADRRGNARDSYLVSLGDLECVKRFD